MKFLVFGVLFLTALYASDAFTISRANDDPIKDALLKEVSELLDEAIKAIDTLKKSGKDELRKGLTKAIEITKSMDTQLKKLNPTTDLGKVLYKGIDTLVVEAEAWLESELKNVPPKEANDDIKDVVLKQVAQILDDARKAIDTLKASGKDALINGLMTVQLFGDFNGFRESFPELILSTLRQSVDRFTRLIQDVRHLLQ
ncbi:unnamed protein product [Oppiella nova]|uniref:Uncharacterized protein n=1 Tax=Oppiella nova TaxID=334625 RepID=A0A7R9M6B7_9ACAR|nr:unnamed protein product [Oppiella nova]CAG2171319.1 unnamed protein product [Oppiella nova]